MIKGGETGGGDVLGTISDVMTSSTTAKVYMYLPLPNEIRNKKVD